MEDAAPKGDDPVAVHSGGLEADVERRFCSLEERLAGLAKALEEMTRTIAEHALKIEEVIVEVDDVQEQHSILMKRLVTMTSAMEEKFAPEADIHRQMRALEEQLASWDGRLTEMVKAMGERGPKADNAIEGPAGQTRGLEKRAEAAERADAELSATMPARALKADDLLERRIRGLEEQLPGLEERFTVMSTTVADSLVKFDDAIADRVCGLEEKLPVLEERVLKIDDVIARQTCGWESQVACLEREVAEVLATTTEHGLRIEDIIEQWIPALEKQRPGPKRHCEMMSTTMEEHASKVDDSISEPLPGFDQRRAAMWTTIEVLAPKVDDLVADVRYLGEHLGQVPVLMEQCTELGATLAEMSSAMSERVLEVDDAFAGRSSRLEKHVGVLEERVSAIMKSMKRCLPSLDTEQRIHGLEEQVAVVSATMDDHWLLLGDILDQSRREGLSAETETRKAPISDPAKEFCQPPGRQDGAHHEDVLTSGMLD